MRRTGLAVAVAAALTAASACTPSGSSGASAEKAPPPRRDATQGAALAGSLAALRTAERSTDRAETARVESTTSMGALMSMTAHGALGWGDGITGTLTITYTGGTMADTMRRLGTTSMEARYLPDAYYARMGEKFAQQADGRHWIRYAYDDLESLAGGSGALLRDQMRTTTPNQCVKLLLASGDVRRVGQETVRGERTTHYAGTVDVARIADAGLKKQLTQAGVTTQTVDVWVNDRDLLAKKVEKARLTTGVLTQTAYYDDYGVKITTGKPPAGDTQDFRELLHKQGGTS
ncbi:lipoprotein [Streptomyces bullii]